jgi:hypothetical protein
VAAGGYSWLTEAEVWLPERDDLLKLGIAPAARVFAVAEWYRRRSDAGIELGGPYLVAEHDRQGTEPAWQPRAILDSSALTRLVAQVEPTVSGSRPSKAGAMQATSRYAGSFGLLGLPLWLKLSDGRSVEGERLDDWRAEVLALAALDRAQLDLHLLSQARPPEQARRRLRAQVHEDTCAEVGCGRMPEARFRYQSDGRDVITFHYGPHAIEFPGNFGMLDNIDNLRRACQRAVALAVSTRLELQLDYGITTDFRLRFGWQPHSLLGALYLQLAARFMGAKPRMRACKRPGCGIAFRAETARQIYCSSKCRKLDYYHRQMEARKP